LVFPSDSTGAFASAALTAGLAGAGVVVFGVESDETALVGALRVRDDSGVLALVGAAFAAVFFAAAVRGRLVVAAFDDFTSAVFSPADFDAAFEGVFAFAGAFLVGLVGAFFAGAFLAGALRVRVDLAFASDVSDAAFLAGAFLVVAAFLAGAFFTGAFFVAAFLAGAFLAVTFLAGAFLGVAFLGAFQPRLQARHHLLCSRRFCCLQIYGLWIYWELAADAPE